MSQVSVFDPVNYKNTTREQWQAVAKAWHEWGPLLHKWLGESTEIMLDMAGVKSGQKILDVAAGAGEQSVTAAKRVGPTGHVLATDLSPNILEFAKQVAQQEGLKNIETRVMDGENLRLEDEAFDVVISRVGLIYFPDQQKALQGMWRVLKPGGKMAAMVYSSAENNKFFSVPISIIRQRGKLPPPAPGQPGPFSLGAPGVLQAAFEKANFKNVQIRIVPAPLKTKNAAECLRFEQESFGALHQMLSGVAESEHESVWKEIETELKKFEGPQGFIGPGEMIVGVGTK